jgi:hypothetical protein
MLDFTQDTDNIRFPTDILPWAVKVVYSPVDHKPDTYNHYALKSADRSLVIGIAELALYVPDGNCKMSRWGARLRENNAG